MKRCKECERFNVEYDPKIGLERCLRRECGWINKEKIDLEKENYECNFKEFRDSLEVKKAILI
ncbi:MAG: hypothetical protein KJ821_04105 [Actinobacteria bacterium]|nr:hypothetical protein [Actinomycetota bacterium]MBU4482783.1 hypothetical protein [Actinomycetota bacterium]